MEYFDEQQIMEVDRTSISLHLIVGGLVAAMNVASALVTLALGG